MSKHNTQTESQSASTGNSWKNNFRNLLRLLRIKSDLHRDDLVEGLSAKHDDHADSFDDNEKRLLKNILILRQRHVEDVMVRRAQISAINISSSLEQVRQTFQETNHSRLPVYRNTLDYPVGIIHIKDVFGFLTQSQQNKFNLEKIVLPPLFVPPSMKVADLLQKMQEQRLHMALVVDEHGGISGLVSIEDLVEEIVGEIEDEHEKEHDSIKKFIRRRDGSIEVPAHIPISELENILDQDLSAEHPTAQTVGGLVSVLSGHVPKKGERITTPSGMTIEIRNADLRRVHTVRIYPMQKMIKAINAKTAKG